MKFQAVPGESNRHGQMPHSHPAGWPREIGLFVDHHFWDSVAGRGAASHRRNERCGHRDEPT
jgi:hypothetical protein